MKSYKVREIIAMLNKDGWVLKATKGDHRQYTHGTRPGKVTISGRMADNIPQGLLNSIFKQAGWK